MADFDDDELDLLQDDGDGIIEVLTVLDEEKKEKPILERTGCLGLIAVIAALPVSLVYIALSLLQK